MKEFLKKQTANHPQWRRQFKAVRRQLGAMVPKSISISQGLLSGKLFATPATPKAQVQAFLRTLFPIRTGKELIRLGPKGDGGYLVPDDLTGIEALFSPGVSFISGFERNCADRGMTVFLADASVDKPAESHERFRFVKKFIGATTSGDFITMDEWVSSSLPGQSSDLMLQMDIEGYEYETFLSMSDPLLRRFRIIVVEFHSFDQLWNRASFGFMRTAFGKLLQTHSVAHIHPNNYAPLIKTNGLLLPPLVEFTFLRKDRIAGASGYAKDFPHPLDSDNTDWPRVDLPKSLIGE